MRWDLVKAEDIRAATKLADIKDDGLDYEMDEGWDRISTILATMKL